MTRGVCESGRSRVIGLYDCKILTILHTIYTRRQEDIRARGGVYVRGGWQGSDKRTLRLQNCFADHL